MEIKTTHDLFTELYKGTMDKRRADKTWVAVSDVIKEIMEKASFGNPNDREEIMKSLSTLHNKN